MGHGSVDSLVDAHFVKPETRRATKHVHTQTLAPHSQCCPPPATIVMPAVRDKHIAVTDVTRLGLQGSPREYRDRLSQRILWQHRCTSGGRRDKDLHSRVNAAKRLQQSCEILVTQDTSVRYNFSSRIAWQNAPRGTCLHLELS